jgi:hypothetical protein
LPIAVIALVQLGENNYPVEKENNYPVEKG